jgi:hypothetical protein
MREAGPTLPKRSRVLTLDGTLVREMTAFMMPEVFPLFVFRAPRRTLIAGSP